MRSLHLKDMMDLNFKRMYYVRYADDFIIGMQGHRQEVKKILTDLSEWLKAELKLELHPDKTFIKHFKS